VLRIVCPACKLIFLRVQIVDDEGVTCPRCATVFQPEEEELYDPEDD
jgi:Zn-finger nucleic acid-binding protein